MSFKFCGLCETLRRHRTASKRGDDVLLSGDAKKRCRGDTLCCRYQGPYTFITITPKGVATIMERASHQKVNISTLKYKI